MGGGFFSGGDLGFENKFPRNEKNEPEEVLGGETMTANGGVYAMAINGQMDGRMDGLKAEEPCEEFKWSLDFGIGSSQSVLERI